MSGVPVNAIPWRSGLSWLAGPIFNRELRVVSRHVRSYALRTGYVMLLCMFLLSAWSWIIGARSIASTALAASRLPEIGRYVTSQVLWFQFIGAQLIAAVVLSASMSRDMRSGTLSVLMTTPITSRQIVVGKLLSGLLQVVLLLAIGLPALGVVRVMGGVPWDLVLAGCCITLTASLFVGALRLWLSTYYGHPYQALSAAAVTYIVVFIGVPGTVIILAFIGGLNPPAVTNILALASPRHAFFRSVSMRVRGGPISTSWPGHCLAVASATSAMLCICSWRLRRLRGQNLSAGAGGFPGTTRLRGSPVMWKDMSPRRCRGSRTDMVIVVAAVGLCALMIWAEIARVPGYQAYAIDICWGFWMMACLRLAISAAGSITREKEGGTWPVLLATPLDDRQIVRDKAIAVLRHNIVWLLSAFAVETCSILCADPGFKLLTAAFYALLRIASAFFVMMAGLYFGTRLKTTNAASAATVGAYLLLNYFVSGRYNPLVAWLLWKCAYGSGGRTGRLILMGLGSMGVTIAFDIVAGGLLLRRTRRIMRRYAV